MAGLRVRFPLIPYNPNRQGSNRKSPVEKLELLPHLWQLLLPFFFFVTRCLIWHLLIWCGFLLVSPQGVGGAVGGRLCLQKSRRENEHFAFNCSPFGASIPAASEGESRQTDIERSFLFFFLPFVKLIYSGIVLDARCAWWVIDYFPPALRAIIPGPDGTMRESWAPEERYVQPYTRHFTLVATVWNIRENSIYTAFRQM